MSYFFNHNTKSRKVMVVIFYMILIEVAIDLLKKSFESKKSLVIMGCYASAIHVDNDIV